MPEDGPRWSEDAPYEYDLKSAREAARLLKVSESTVWRYAAQDLLPAYRVGPKRVRFRVGDLYALLNQRRKKGPEVAIRDRLRLFAMTDDAGTDAAEAMVRAANLRSAILARRGGVALAASWEDIAAAREERSEDL